MVGVLEPACRRARRREAAPRTTRHGGAAVRAILPADPLQGARANLEQLDAHPPALEANRPQWRTNRRQLLQFIAYVEGLEDDA